MRFIVILIQSFLRLPVINQIVSGSLLFLASFFILKYGFNYFANHILFLPKKTHLILNMMFSSSLAICAFWDFGQKTGQFLLKNILKSMVLFLPLSFLIYKSKISFNNITLLGISIFITLSSSLGYKILSKRKKTILNKTMSEIDNFGRDANGNKNTKIAGDLFEEYIRDCFKMMGYTAYTTTEMKQKGLAPKGLEKLSGDGGADVIAKAPDGETLVIQCKHYSNTVGVEACYQAHGALKVYNGTQAVVITNHFFTEEAKFNAEQNEILLMDRFKLTQFIADVSKSSEKNKTEKNLLEKLFNKDKLLYKKVG